MTPQPVDIRCTCSKKTLLARARAGVDGEWWIHVKSWKQQRLYIEVMVQGVVKVRCRDCLRWQKIRMQRDSITLQPVTVPDELHE